MRLLTSILIGLLFVSCTSVSKKRERLAQAPAPVQKQIELAKNYFKNRNYNKVEETLVPIVKDHRGTDAGDEALFILAKTYSRTEAWDKAYRVYSMIFESGFYSPKEFVARTNAAKILTYKLNKSDTALKLVDQSLKLGPDPLQRADLLEVKFSALMKNGSQLEAFETLVELSEKHPMASEREAFKRKAKAFLDSRLSGPELKDFANDSPTSELKTDAMYRYAVHLMGEGEYSEARSYLKKVVEDNPKSYTGMQAQQLLEQLSARDQVNPRTIGVVLPLSGRYAPMGYQTLQGLQLALGIKGGINDANVRLAVIDSAGKPEFARRGVKRLVEENHVIAVVGGLLSKTAYSASIQAQELGVPFITLSQKEDLTDIGPFIFRNALTIESQIDELIKTAMEELKFKRFAILYPNDSYGVKISNLFWRKVKERGGTVTGAQAYLPGETDFNEPIKKLVGTFYVEDRQDEYKARLKEWYEKLGKSARRRKKPPVGLLPPIVDFEAIFIPDGPKALGQIAPMLAYNDVTNVYLIGTNIWNSKEFLRRGQNFVSLSLFADGLYGEDERFLKSKFYQDYSTTFNKSPTSFSLQGYDTGLVLRSVLAAGSSSRVDFAGEIRKNKGVPGALNTLVLNGKKEFVRPVVTLTVKDGSIVPFTKEQETKKQ
ncbi:MAG: penicillin-binding protein activator [Bdellovibrionales bacterium]|nr:penicillin-binding protein activator [Bdellovibrionales bacterium]